MTEKARKLAETIREGRRLERNKRRNGRVPAEQGENIQFVDGGYLTLTDAVGHDMRVRYDPGQEMMLDVLATTGCDEYTIDRADIGPRGAAVTATAVRSMYEEICDALREIGLDINNNGVTLRGDSRDTEKRMIGSSIAEMARRFGGAMCWPAGDYSVLFEGLDETDIPDGQDAGELEAFLNGFAVNKLEATI